MKKFKKFIQSKGGIWVLLGTIALILIASFLILVGVVYTNFGGDWNRIPEILSSDFAISVYIIIGLTIFALVIVTITLNRNKEIK